MLNKKTVGQPDGHYQKVSELFRDIGQLCQSSGKEGRLKLDQSTGRLGLREVTRDSYLTARVSLAPALPEVARVINDMTVAAAEWEQKLQIPVTAEQFKVDLRFDPTPGRLCQHLDALLNQKSSQYLRLSERIMTRLKACGANPGEDWQNCNRQYEAIEQEFFDGYRRLMALHSGDLNSLNEEFHSFLDIALVAAQTYLEGLSLASEVREQLLQGLYQRVQWFVDLMENYCLQTESKAHRLVAWTVTESSLDMPAPGFPFSTLRTYRAPVTAPFYMERQQKQSCSQHAANAFFGGPLVLKPVSLVPRAMDEVLLDMKHVLQKISQESLFGRELILHGGQYQMTPELTESLDQLQHDRVMLVSAINGHYLAFRRDTAGKWYKLDSAAYEQGEQEVISPGRYLKERIYQGYNMDNLELEAAQLDIICLKGENLPGLVFEF